MGNPCLNFRMANNMRKHNSSEHYRALFKELDAKGSIEAQLDSITLASARTASANPAQWHTYLYGVDGGSEGSTQTTISSLRLLATRARDGDVTMDSTTNNNPNIAQLRRILLLATSRKLSSDGYDHHYVDDMGLLGVAPAGNEAQTEAAITRARAGTYALAGTGPRKRPRADTDLLWPADSSTALRAPYTCVDVLPIFGDDPPTEPVTSTPQSYTSILGTSNPVLRSVKARRRILRLRAAALQQSRLPPSPPPPPPPPLSLTTPPAPPPRATRYAEMGRAAAALLLEHAGYTHSSSRALDVLVDSAAQFIARAASRLSSARERFDSNSDGSHTPHNRLALAQAALADVRGGTASLQSYATWEARKAAAELASAEERLTARGARAPTPPVPPVPDKSDPSAKLNAATYSFGVLPDGAHIDVLGIEPVPPRAMACAAVQVSDPDAK